MGYCILGMDCASVYVRLFCIHMGISEMNIMIKALLLAYFLLMVMVTIFGVIWTLTAIFTPKWATKKALLMKYQNNIKHMK